GASSSAGSLPSERVAIRSRSCSPSTIANSAFVPASFIDAAGTFLKVNAGVALPESLCSIATPISPREYAAPNNRAVTQSSLISLGMQFRLNREGIVLSRFNIGNARDWQASPVYMDESTNRVSSTSQINDPPPISPGQ